MSSFVYFFGGAVTVAGALVGLLFVALSVSPQRLQRGPDAVEHQATAATAFTALVDALFISLIALEPDAGYRWGALVFGLLGLTSTTALAMRLWRARAHTKINQRWPMTLGLIMAVYVAQTVSGIGHAGPGTTATFVYILFATGIARAWQLLGLRGGGLIDVLVEELHRRRQDTPES